MALNEVLRQEQKYLISMEEYKRYSHRFAQLITQDSHNGSQGYKIRSLYFDTMDNKDYWDKENGLELRKKIRLRIYGLGGDFAALEMKQKQGDSQKKRSLQISREDAVLLSQGNYSPLLDYKDSFALECYAIMNCDCYRPKSVIEYNRMAFVSNECKTRITFDSEICSSESSFDLFSENLLLYPVIDSFLSVLEIKYDGFLVSYIQDIINEINKSRVSVSKYCLGRSVSINYYF